MGIHEKIVHQRSDLTPGKCAPTLAYGKTIISDPVNWTLGAAVKIMDANTATRNFIVTDVIIECDLSAWIEAEEP
jgi:hypothetical protein